MVNDKPPRFWWVDRWVLQSYFEQGLSKIGKWIDKKIYPRRLALLCRLFPHDWQPSPNEMIWLTDWWGEGEPWGVFHRCQRCGEPDPSWEYDWYPDEEE